jgi:hypothetical protein
MEVIVMYHTVVVFSSVRDTADLNLEILLFFTGTDPLLLDLQLGSFCISVRSFVKVAVF